jgi:hypothetical protein
MAFRRKSTERALREIDHLRAKHPQSELAATDNILDVAYFTEFVPRLAERRNAGVFYEVKANLRRDQLQALARAGIREIQPGIESLSDQVLRIMRKGVQALQNVQLLSQPVGRPRQRECRDVHVRSWRPFWRVHGWSSWGLIR